MAYRLLTVLCALFAAQGVFSGEEELREDLFLSAPEQIAALRSSSSDLIGGVICPLSGQPTLRVIDLVARGAQDIVLSRTYLPFLVPSIFPQHAQNQEQHEKKWLYYYLREHYKGWQFYPHLRLQLNPSTMVVRLAEPNGATLDFRLTGSGYCHTELASASYGISNLKDGLPSGRHDPRNTRIAYEERDNRIVVHAPEGTTRIYLRKGWATQSSHLYMLDQEILPHGKVLKYCYDEKGHLIQVEGRDLGGKHLYSILVIEGSLQEGYYRFTTPSGLSAQYDYVKRPIHWKIKEKVDGGKHKEECSLICPPILTQVSSPFYREEGLDYSKRFLLNSYCGKEELFNLHYTADGQGTGYQKVEQLLFPIGEGDTYIPIYQFLYQPPSAGKKGGKTMIKRDDGAITAIEFSDQLLPIMIQSFGPDGSLQQEKVIKWNGNNWLRSVEVRDGRQNLLHRKSYEYDSFGNPVQEIFTGDLTGSGEEEAFVTTRKFSEEGRHLLLKEEGEDGKVVCYDYLPGTHLLKSKLTKDRDKILWREFWNYDGCCNLIQMICDNGSAENQNDLTGVSDRTVELYTLRQSDPFLHLPEWTEVRIFEGGREKVLKRTHLSYDVHGNVAEEAVYDGEGQLSYTIQKTYNERGDILTETNYLGQQANYTYDSRGRLKTPLKFSHRIYATFHEEIRERVRGKIDNTSDKSTDQGIKQTFDPFGQLVAKTDAQGGVTTYRYNAYGSPVEIIYPDGQKESFIYSKNGFLAVHTALDGNVTVYERDLLGKVVKKSYYSPSGEFLAQEAF
jgi:YD repeat-containing protein